MGVLRTSSVLAVVSVNDRRSLLFDVESDQRFSKVLGYTPEHLNTDLEKVGGQGPVKSQRNMKSLA